MSFDLGSVYAKIEADISGFQSNLNTIENRIENFGTKIASTGKKLSLFLTTPILAGGVAAVKSAGDYEQLEIALTTMLGSQEKALKLLKEVEAFAKKTPFQYTELTQSTKQLLAYGFGAEEVLGVLKSLGDVAAGVGKDKLPQLTLAIGQIEAKGQLMGQELRQLQETGFPILEMLAEHYGVTTEKIYEMTSAGEISSDVVLQMFQQATSEGGKFFDLMAKTSETTLGQFSNLQDEIGFLARDIGVIMLPVVMELIQHLRDLVSWINGLSEEHKRAIVVIGLVVAAIGPFLIALSTLISIIQGVITIGTAMGALFTFLSANPIILIIAAIVAIIAVGILLIKNWDKVMAAAQVMVDWIGDKWEALKNKLSELGGKILDAIMWPFNEAKKRIEETVNWIKDKLDFTKRHSPSVVDIVNRGVREVNKALQGLDFSPNLAPHAAFAVSNQSTNSPVVNQIKVDMSGAIITDASGAMEMGEILGDSIIKRLQQNIRF